MCLTTLIAVRQHSIRLTPPEHLKRENSNAGTGALLGLAVQEHVLEVAHTGGGDFITTDRPTFDLRRVAGRMQLVSDFDPCSGGVMH